jgi:chromosome transmission fidelity protein 1
MSDYVTHLFSYLPPERLGTFSYGHVIPHTNLVAQSLTQGLLGSEFDFTYEKRNSEKMVRYPQPRHVIVHIKIFARLSTLDAP